LTLELPRLVIEPFQRRQLFLTAKLRILDRGLKHLNGPVVNPERDWERMPVLSSMRE